MHNPTRNKKKLKRKKKCKGSNEDFDIYILHLCIWQMLLSKATYIELQATHLHSYQFLLSLAIEPMTLALQAPTL